MNLRHPSLSWFVAWRYFFAKKSTNAVNIISIVAVVGIALVALAMVVVMSVYNGFEELTDRQFSAFSPEYKIVHISGGAFHSSDVDIPGTAPVLSEQAVASFEDNKAVVRLVGVETESFIGIIPMDNFIFDGAFDLGDDGYPMAVIGIGVASSLGAGADYQSALELSLPKRIGRISSAVPARTFITRSVHVSGVFRIDSQEDTEVVYLPLSAMRQMLQYTGDEVSYLITSKAASGLSREQIQYKIGADYRVLDRYEQYPEVYKVLKVEKMVTFLLLSFVLILSLFSVISTLGMLIIEKQDDTRLLTMLGARAGLIDRIVITQSWLLSISGLVLGLLTGVALVLLQQYFGIVTMGGSGPGAFIVDVYPVQLRILDLLWISVVILVVGWVSSRVAYHLFMSRRV